MRCALSIAFGFIAFTECSGCVPLPTFEYSEHAIDVRHVAGSAKSRGSIRPGVTSYADVRRLLGEPIVMSDREWWYISEGYTGLLWYPLNSAADCPLYQRAYCLQLHFAEDGLVNKYDLVRTAWSDTSLGFAVSGGGAGYQPPEDDARHLISDLPETIDHQQR